MNAHKCTYTQPHDFNVGVGFDGAPLSAWTPTNKGLISPNLRNNGGTFEDY